MKICYRVEKGFKFQPLKWNKPETMGLVTNFIFYFIHKTSLHLNFKFVLFTNFLKSFNINQHILIFIEYKYHGHTQGGGRLTPPPCVCPWYLYSINIRMCFIERWKESKAFLDKENRMTYRRWNKLEQNDIQKLE